MRPNVDDVDSGVLLIGEFHLDLNLRCLRRGDERIRISSKPFSTLEFLVENRHRIVSKAELLEKVWQGQREISSVEHAICELRRTLGDAPGTPQYIETVPGQGYHWIAEIQTVKGVFDGEGASRVESDGAETEVGVARIDTRGGFLRQLLVASAGIATLVGLFVAIVYVRKPPHIARVAISGDTLLAMDATGSELWRYVFEAPLRDPGPGEAGWRTQIADLNGDGVPDVLVAAAFRGLNETQIGKEELFCFSARGKLLWRYRPEMHMEFRHSAFDGPWHLAQVLVAPEGRSSSVWVAVNHGVWWPAYVLKFTAWGASTVAFTNSGSIFALHRIQMKSGTYVLAAGVNNEYRLASVAVLAEHGSPATSPQGEASPFECLGCPGGRPYRYILLPRSEVNVAGSLPYNLASGVFDRSRGVMVETWETIDHLEAGESLSGFFEFSQDLRPEKVSYADSYPKFHKRDEDLGWIKHSWSDCPERRSPALLRVADEHGLWSRIEIPRVP